MLTGISWGACRWPSRATPPVQPQPYGIPRRPKVVVVEIKAPTRTISFTCDLRAGAKEILLRYKGSRFRFQMVRPDFSTPTISSLTAYGERCTVCSTQVLISSQRSTVRSRSSSRDACAQAAVRKHFLIPADP